MNKPGGRLSAVTLAVLNMLLVWFGIFPQHLIQYIHAVAATVR